MNTPIYIPMTVSVDAETIPMSVALDAVVLPMMIGVTGTHQGGGGTSDFEVHPVTITSTSNVFINAPFLSTYPPDALAGQYYISRNTPTTVDFVFYKGRCYTGLDDMWVLSGAAALDEEYYRWYFTGEGSVSIEPD